MLTKLFQKPVRSADPTFEPITLEEAKKQVELPLEYMYHDEHLINLIQNARETVEHDTGIIGATGTFTLKLDMWPSSDWLELSVRPITSITSISYTDTGGTSQTFAGASYTLSTSSVTPALFLTYGSSWPTNRGHYQDITITFVAGYATRGAIPQMFKQACLLDVERNFERESVDLDKVVRAYEMLIRRLQRSTYP